MLSSGMIGFLIGFFVGACFPLVFAIILYICGFACIGITAGTCASAMMSAYHPIASKSVYAYFQSCGMTFPYGCFWIAGYLILGAGCGGAGYYIGDHYFS